MPSQSDVLSVVLNYKKPDLTLECVKHLRAQRGVATDVLVVDNASDDGSAEKLECERSGFDLTVRESNQGFAGGMNFGLSEALSKKYRYVWLVNNDAFPDPDCLRLLIEQMEADAELAMLTPRLLSADRSEQHAGGLVDWRTSQHTLMMSADLANPAGREFPDGTWVAGTAPLIRTSVLQQVGLFEPAFFAYWEDVDLSVRMTRAGYRIGAAPHAEVLHFANATSGLESPFVQFLLTRNAWLFLERNGRVGSTRVKWLRFLSRFVRRAADFELFGKKRLAQAVLGGISAARKRRYAAPDAFLGPRGVERLYA